MRILYLITKSEIGGAQIHLAHLLKYFSKGNEVALMSAPRGWLNDEAGKYGVRIYPNIFFSNSFNPFRLLKAESLIRQTVRDFQPDLVCCHSSMAGFLGRLAIKGRVPTIYTAHGFAFTPAALFWRRISAIIAEKMVSRYAFKIIAVSEFDRELALKNHIAKSEKIVVIHNGVEIGPAKEKQNSEPVEILSIGRLAYPKMPDLIIRSFAQLPTALKKKAHLKIAGSGPYQEELTGLINNLNVVDSVSLTGEIDHERILAILPRADIFILVTKHEGLPLTVLEAMSAGLPVIASSVGGVPEEVSDGLSGVLIKDNNVGEISAAMKYLIENPQERISMGESGRKIIGERFSLDKLIHETNKIYEQATS